MSTLARNECRELLRYNYTPDERREKGQQLADTHIRLGAVNDELDRIKSDYKAKIQLHETEISTLSTQVSTGYEMREYVCFFEYDQPEKGKKTLRRKEPPCDIVRVEEMTIADRQTVMDAIDKQAAEAQPDPKDGAIVLFPGSPAGPRNVTPTAPAPEDDELAWAAQLEAQRKERAKEDAEKKKAVKGRRTSSGGVVATSEDGDEITTEDDKKGS